MNSDIYFINVRKMTQQKGMCAEEHSSMSFPLFVAFPDQSARLTALQLEQHGFGVRRISIRSVFWDPITMNVHVKIENENERVFKLDAARAASVFPKKCIECEHCINYNGLCWNH